MANNLMHSAGHKYISKKWSNGHWVYRYPDDSSKPKRPRSREKKIDGEGEVYIRDRNVEYDEKTGTTRVSSVFVPSDKSDPYGIKHPYMRVAPVPDKVKELGLPLGPTSGTLGSEFNNIVTDMARKKFKEIVDVSKYGKNYFTGKEMLKTLASKKIVSK